MQSSPWNPTKAHRVSRAYKEITRNIENGLKSGMLAYCLEYAFAKICKELSIFGLQDAIKRQLLCTAHCALRKTKQARSKLLSSFLHCHPCHKRCQSTSHHRATCGCTGGRASGNLRPWESVGSFVVFCSNSFTVDACALHGNKVLWSSISIWALQIDGAHIAAHPWIWHHSASEVGRSWTTRGTNGSTLLTSEASICRHIHCPAPCGTTGCETGKDLDCQCTHSSCNCFRHHGLCLSQGSAKSHWQMSGNLNQSCKNTKLCAGSAACPKRSKRYFKKTNKSHTLNSGFVGSQFEQSAFRIGIKTWPLGMSPSFE